MKNSEEKELEEKGRVYTDEEQKKMNNQQQKKKN